jgi:phenylacetate-CoA ligase
MIHDWKMEVYWHLPVFLQEAALSAYTNRLDKLYYGKEYEEWRERSKSWQSWSRTDADKWQSQQLEQLIQLAATRIPYYRKEWKKIDWKSIRTASDLHLLPRLEKQSIRQNEQAFIVEGLNPKSLWMEKTSGTTGTSLRIYFPKSMLPNFWAIIEVMVRNSVGVAREIPRAMMGGNPVVRGNTNKPPFWRYNRRWKQLYLSSYHVSQSTAKGYATAIQMYRSEWITGYGSTIAALAGFALDGDLPPVPVRTVIASGDTLMPGMRKSIETFFQCKCFDQYGQAEKIAFTMECAQGKMHVIPGLGIWEILRDDGSPCPPGEVGEIVATGLLNDAMPLIRYRLGDYAAWAEDQSCTCGNMQPIITKLDGRVDDYLITSDGRQIGRLSTAVKRSPTIHSAQLVQDQPGHAYLLVRPSDNYRSAHATAIRDDIIERIGRFDLEMREVPEIPKTLQGKTRLVVRLGERPEMRETYEKLLNND